MPTENNTTATEAVYNQLNDQALSIEAVQRFEQMMRIRAFSPFEDEVLIRPTPKKVVKKKTTAQLLDELSSKNCEVFDSVNKIQAEINAIEGDRIKELALKYDDLLFMVIDKNYSLKGLSEGKTLSYINTLQQSLLKTLIRYVYNPERFRELTEGQFIENLLDLLMSRIMIDDKNLPIIKDMGKDLFKFTNDITEAKKKKKEVMGRQESKPTVCEDYLNEQHRTISGTPRFDPFTTTIDRGGVASRGSAGMVRLEVRPF